MQELIEGSLHSSSICEKCLVTTFRCIEARRDYSEAAAAKMGPINPVAKATRLHSEGFTPASCATGAEMLKMTRMRKSRHSFCPRFDLAAGLAGCQRSNARLSENPIKSAFLGRTDSDKRDFRTTGDRHEATES